MDDDKFINQLMSNVDKDNKEKEGISMIRIQVEEQYTVENIERI